MARLNILFIAPHPIEGPSTRFRICQYFPALDAAGIGYELRPFLSSRLAPAAYAKGALAAKLGVTAWSSLKRCGDVVRASRADLVYVLREAFPFGPEVFERLMEAASGRLAFDFDDVIWANAANYDNPLDRLRDWNRPARLMARARRVIAGSDHLADYARRHATDPSRVVVLPTVVDTKRFRPRPREGDGTVVVGWIGTPRNTSYIRAVWPALAAAAAADRRIRYLFVGAEAFDTGDVPVEFRPWAMDREIRDIQDFDVGIMPLSNDEQSRGKCGFKLIEYMACGLPAVASPIGANVEILADGETGLWADGHDAWIGTLRLLASEPDRRAAMSAAARLRAERRYSLAAMAPRFVEVVRGAAGG